MKKNKQGRPKLLKKKIPTNFGIEEDIHQAFEAFCADEHRAKTQALNMLLEIALKQKGYL